MFKINFRETNYYYFFWKPHGIPTTFGKEKSFIEILKVSDKLDFLNNQNKEFPGDLELGLLNRLDNDTSGLIYFAKTKKIFEDYKNLQLQNKIQKIYIVDIVGEFYYEDYIIDYSIMHHKHLDNKMIAVKYEKDKQKGRGKLLSEKTFVKKLYYDKETNRSTLQVTINKGIRHQIRVHLSSIGYPIVGDKIYNKKNEDSYLHLWSIGLEI